MQSKQLVVRTKDPSDQRRSLIEIGPKGKELMHLLDFYKDINDVLLAGLSSKESKQLISLLERVLGNINGALQV